MASIISEKKPGREVFFGIVMKFQHFKELVQFSKSPVQPEMRRNDEKIESIKDGSIDLVEGLVHKKKSGGWKASGLNILGKSLYVYINIIYVLRMQERL